MVWWPTHDFILGKLRQSWPTGPTWPAGDPWGPTWPTGAIWPTGDTWPTWPAGATWPTGAAWSVGPTWPTGRTGADWPIGPTWPADGPTWDTGPTGPAWAAGPTGPTWRTGPQWDLWPTWPTGWTGAASTVTWPTWPAWAVWPTWPTWWTWSDWPTWPTWWTGPSWAGGGFRTDVPWTPTRVSDTVFTITDTSNAGLYDQLLQRGTVLKRTQSWTKQAMVVSATYAANTVTVTVIWDTLSVWFSDMKYGLEKARIYKFALAWTIGATGTNVMNTQMVESPSKIYWADFRAGTAWNGTTTVDINKGGSSMFATRPSILTTNQNILWVTADTGTTATTGDYITIDVDAVAWTTKIIDAYVNLYYMPLYMANLA